MLYQKSYAVAILLAAALISCQQQLATGKFQTDFRITRLRCKNSNVNPSVFGIVYVKDETGVHQWPSSILRFDRRVFLYVKNDGSYAQSLLPGPHEIFAFQIGYTSVKINPLLLEKGDSVRIDFLLRADMEAVVY